VAYCFRKKESVSKAIRRLTRGRIEDALQCLQDCAQAEAIHCARKDIKKVRAVLRLVRTGISRKEFSRLARCLRDAANLLAALREAYVKDRTLLALTRHFKGRLTAGSLRGIRAELRQGFQEEMKRFAQEKTAATVERKLHRLAKELKHLDVGGKGWKALSPGVKRAYRRGRRAYETVLKDASPENLHEWRKSAKDLWYQVTLLHPVWPEQMEAMADELKTLTEHLGDDHDLFVLEESLGKDSRQQERRILHELIVERRRDLRAAAITLGKRLYAAKPSLFCNRLAGYWHAWRA
jgi:CHAD domain-containing protein